MKRSFLKRVIILAGIIALSHADAAIASEQGIEMKASRILWYDAPATNWEKEALPIGNGRLGGMIFGGVSSERIQFNEDSLWIGDETDTGAYQAFGDLLVNLHAEDPAPKSLRCPSGQTAANPGEQIGMSVDGDVNTKWCLPHENRPVQWQVKLEEPVVVRTYSLTSANDVPTRDPKEWTWEGSQDGQAWQRLDHRVDEEPFPQRKLKQTYHFKNDTPYRFYRLTLLANHGEARYQLSEIALEGVAISPADGSAPVAAQAYRRELDIRRAVHTTTYNQAGINYKREYFASHPAQVMVFRFTADQPGAYTGTINLTDAHQAVISVDHDTITAAGSLAGYQFEGYRGRAKKPFTMALDYEARVRVLHDGGSLATDGHGIAFKNCDTLTVLLAADTNYLNRRDQGWKKEHPHQLLVSQLAAAAAKPFAVLLEEHVRDYQSLFNRLKLDLGGSGAGIPTDKLLERYQQQADRAVEELLFQFARYLMISCSRPGAMPANLQGLWNDKNSPPWRCDYHSDVNVEMNYWFVDAANLPGCFDPLAEWLHSIRSVRHEVTKKQFGIDRGWMLQAENGIFGGGSAFWSKGDAAWIAQNLYDHYAFTQDDTYLRERLYPVLKELCEHWEDGLKELEDGTLVSPDGYSPEHGPREDGVSFDQQLVYDLFTNFIEVSEILGRDEAFRRKVAAMRDKLLAPKIGSWGQLQEWMVDRDDPNDKHRHVNHMIAVYPGRQISPSTTPALAAAAKISMNARGDKTTGWSRAWKTAIWARLHDGNRAYRILNGLVAERVYPNFLATHPPFQIDANFGYAAGVCEMLLQSHLGNIHLLPALPDAWSDGSVGGLRARGDYTVDIRWEKGELVEAVVHAGRKSPGKVNVIYQDQSRTVTVKPGEKVSLDSAEFTE